MSFDAYPERQFVTEFYNNNVLADHHIWSTIKTLPATLPEPRTMDRGPRTGVTEGVFSSDLDFTITNFFVNFYLIELIVVLDETFAVQAILLQNFWQILGLGMK